MWRESAFSLTPGHLPNILPARKPGVNFRLGPNRRYSHSLPLSKHIPINIIFHMERDGHVT